MNTETVRREDWVVGGLALLLVIDLLELPWYTIGGGTVSGISLPSISNPATGSPAAFLGVLAVIAVLAVLADLIFLYLSPDTDLPAIDGNRSFTRFVLASTAAALLALKFILHVTQIGHMGIGFWFGIVLAAALVVATHMGRRDEPKPQAEAEEEEASEGRSEGRPESRSRSEGPPGSRSERQSRSESQPRSESRAEDDARTEDENESGDRDPQGGGAEGSEPSAEEPERSAPSGP